MQAFNKEQQQYIKSLLNDAMANAAMSLSGMLGVNVTHDPAQMFIANGETKIYPCFKSDPQVVLLVTPLMGDLPGKSFLVFDRADVNTMMLLNPIKSSSLSPDILRETLLKEIDNVVSASFVTTVANRLSLSVFGDVPEIHSLSPAVANDLIHQYTPGDTSAMVCQSNFIMAGKPGFGPQFIWKFNIPVLQQSINRAVATVGNG